MHFIKIEEIYYFILFLLFFKQLQLQLHLSCFFMAQSSPAKLRNWDQHNCVSYSWAMVLLSTLAQFLCRVLGSTGYLIVFHIRHTRTSGTQHLRKADSQLTYHNQNLLLFQKMKDFNRSYLEGLLGMSYNIRNLQQNLPEFTKFKEFWCSWLSMPV